MPNLIYANGMTAIKLRVFLRDTSKLSNQGLTGLTFSSAGLIISTIADNEASATTYTQVGSTIETITTLGTFAAPTATKCRFKEIDATNFPGEYELQIADARWAVSGATYVDVSMPLVAGLNLGQLIPQRVQLWAVNPQDATAFGVSVLTNFAANVRSAIGMASANLDTQLSNILTAVNNISLTGIPAAVWNYAIASWGAATTAGGFLQTTLNSIASKLNNSPITITSPVDNSGTLRIVQWQTYSIADNTQIQVSVSVPTDPTGSAALFTFSFGLQQQTYAGTIISYNSGTGAAVFGLELTAAQTGVLPVGTQFTYSLGTVLTSSNGNLIPVYFKPGNLQVFAAGNPA